MQLTIKIEGKCDDTFGLIWGTRAFRLAEKRLNMELNEIFLSVNDEAVMLALTYSALENWIQNKDESLSLPFTLVQFENWLNDQDQKVATDIVKDYQNSTMQGKSIGERYKEIEEIYALAEASKNGGKETVKKKVKSPLPKS